MRPIKSPIILASLVFFAGFSNTSAAQDDVTGLYSQKYINAIGDSLTAGGGWTEALSKLSGLTVYDGGTGGENSQTIMARQGADPMTVNNVTIPADLTPVVIADRDVDGGISTELGNLVTPLLQGGGHHVNPSYIGDVEGTLSWTGVDYADQTGDWLFTRSQVGSEVEITRPTAIRTNMDINRNAAIQIIFMGQNGGYTDIDDLIWQHERMIEHSHASATLILGLSSGTEAERAAYESAMQERFGRYFVSLRQYLAHPIYDVDGVTIVSSWGLDDAGLTASADDISAISEGRTPPSLLRDAVHYNDFGKAVIGEYIFRKMRDLNLFN